MTILPPFGLSDHNVVILRSNTRAPKDGPSRKTLCRRDTRASQKSELGRFFSYTDWSAIHSTANCESKSALFTDTIRIGLDHIMPIKHIRLHTNDPRGLTSNSTTLNSASKSFYRMKDRLSAAPQCRQSRAEITSQQVLCVKNQ